MISNNVHAYTRISAKSINLNLNNMLFVSEVAVWQSKRLSTVESEESNNKQ